MKLILLSTDLMISSLVAGAANQQNLQVFAARDQAAAEQAISDHDARLLVIDLRCAGVSIAELVATCRQRAAGRLPIVAFGPHVHEASLAAARKAGCDMVATRGQFDRDASSIFSRLLDAE